MTEHPRPTAPAKPAADAPNAGAPRTRPDAESSSAAPPRPGRSARPGPVRDEAAGTGSELGASDREERGQPGGGGARAAAKPDLAGLAAAVRSIERGENPAAPAPRGDAAAARRKRREAMAAETAALQAQEAAETEGAAAAGAGPDDVPAPSQDARSAPQPSAVPDEAEHAPESDGRRPHGAEAAAGPDDAEAARHAGAEDGGPRAAGRPTARTPGTGGAAAGGPTPGEDGRDGDGPHPAGASRTQAPGPDAAAEGPRPGDAGAERAAPYPAGRAGGQAPVDERAVAAVRGVLAQGGAPEGLAEAAVRAWGDGAAAALREDPWLVLGLAGVRVEQADAFARALLGPECGPGDERRTRALVGLLMEKAAEQGHTALAAEALRTALARHAVPDPEAAVAAAVADGQVLVFRDESALPEGDDEADVPLLLGLDRYALAEESLADGFVRLLRTFEGGAGDADWAKAAAGAPSPSAAELIRTAADAGLVVHCGGEAARAEPAALVAAARAAGLRAYAAAYTDSGRRRLAEAVGDDAAATVEGLLAGGQGPGRAADGSLALDLLAVLDAPQLSVEEAATLVEAVPDGARLVLSGDPHTLWSAAPGRAFADLLASRACPRVTSRTPDPGPIGELVSCVAEGELAAVDAPDREVVVVPVRDPAEALLRAVQLVADSVPRAIGVAADRTQVITLTHGGPVGTRALNAALKERLNPGPGRFGGFDPGDRVVYVPVPGRTLPGTVAGAEPDGLRLECGHGPVLVPRAEVAATVRHGWAITGHQAAGMRWPAVVVVVPGDAGPLLTRSWVYTAFGRGERHLSVVQGADQGLAHAVAGPAAKERTTRLAAVLRELEASG